ncbi:MAG: hypothetical protein A2Z04_00640 [Chloroflexi bacterium RBG_16_57_9]|nr:MAG: hypothetical protein A2Z04_00640 [Chloroflexi bacterium RBG_16_57_9]
MKISPAKLEKQAEPAGEIALLFPAQGYRSEEEYLALNTNHLVEYSDGRIEVLPMPTDKHQAIVAYLFMILLALTQRIGGTVRFSPLRIRLWPGKFREPDLMLLLASHDHLRHNQYWEGADLVMEVVSPDDPERDLVTKRQEYAQAGIPEYWIVDPQAETITVLVLDNNAYAEHGRFGRSAVAASATLPALQVEVDAVFDAA